MQMKLVTPEAVGIPSERVLRFVRTLEENRLSTHHLRMARGNFVFFSHDWAPFTPDFPHRQYSVSKSFVSLAVGFAVQDGLLSLDDPISKFFPAECEAYADDYVKHQTVRHMLMMSTAKPALNWFRKRSPDRVAVYFDNPGPSRPSGTLFEYDSSGSFVLGAMVERLTGKPFMEYLREKLFRTIGVSEEARCLKCPGGHSWGDSGVLCTADDLLLTARFVLNGGSWSGKQILSSSYVRAATSKQIDNSLEGAPGWETLGYGYQFWIGYDNSFFFNGMGCQFALCVPGKDLILVINSDNQGKPEARKIILDAFREQIVKPADEPLPENHAAYTALRDYADPLALAADAGSTDSPVRERISGREFVLKPNPMGMERFTLTLDRDGGVFSWTNATGDHELPFGMCENVFGLFPEEGYSDETGSVPEPGHTYRSASSAAWVSPFQLHLKVQIIDKYFGTMNALFGFADGPDGEPRAAVQMNKTAEDFLDGYAGFAASAY